ncbi:hypothetical protein M9458_056115 [Cirrhinus mrigala]|uniref:Uncharacterized protein n=1 Tax=Cirrhinus mrigala TaxID=683832 RepID=A0ABD0ME55_CIRMR
MMTPAPLWLPSSANGEPEPAVTGEISPYGATEPQIVTLVQVQPTTTSALRENAVACDIAEGSSAYCNMPEVLHLCSGFATGLPVSIGVTAAGSLVSAFDTVAPPWAPSSLLSAVALQSTGSTVLSRPGFHFSVCASSLRASGSAIPLAPPWSSVAATPPHPPGSTAPRRSPVPLGPPDPPHHPGSLALLFHLGLLHHLLCPPPGVVSPSSSMAPPSVSSTVGCHHGCVLGPVWLLLLQLFPVLAPAPLSVWSALVPPVSSLAPPFIISNLDSVLRSPSFLPEPPPKFSPMPTGREAIMSRVWTVLCLFSSPPAL